MRPGTRHDAQRPGARLTQPAVGGQSTPYACTPGDANDPVPSLSLATTASNPIIHVGEIPGALCLAQLQQLGLLTMLDSTAGYLTSTASSLYGRVRIASRVLPKMTVAAGPLAFWIWWGGSFPHQITIVSNSHFRSTVFGRRICVFDREVAPEDYHHIDGITLTSPARTACDITCLPPDEFAERFGLRNLSSFLQYYEVSQKDCRAKLESNPRWPARANGLQVFDDLEKIGL